MSVGAATASAGKAWRFEEFEVDAQRNLLRRDGRRVYIPPKALEILIYLLRHHGRTVSKAELLETVWAGAVVEDNTIASAIAQLRRALGERPKDARYVITVPGNGYRFVADISGIETLPPEHPPGTPLHLDPVAPSWDMWSVSRPSRGSDWRTPYDPSALVAGKTLGQWHTCWWRFVLERPGEAGHPPPLEDLDLSESPVVDGVAFLFKAIAQPAICEGIRLVPAGVPVLVLIRGYNVDNFGLPPHEQLDEREMLALLARLTDDIDDLILEVDGQAVGDLRRFRAGPQHFMVTPGAADSLYHRLGTAPTPLAQPAVCDGYLAAFPPPPPGEHTVRFGGTGRINGERVRREVTYRLTVA
jgi:DNA-binding winged helix-turn-helix (wHTH) protein